MESSGSSGISYTTKELLTRLEEKIDGIDRKLDKKVDASVFEKVQIRVDQAADRAAVVALESRLNALALQIELQDKVNVALSDKSKELANDSARNFTRTEKIVALLLNIVAILVTVYLTRSH